MVRYPVEEIRRRKRVKNTEALTQYGMKRKKMETQEQREAISLALLFSDNERMRTLGGLARDAFYAKTSFLTLCEKCHVQFYEVQAEIVKVKKAEGMMRLSLKLPDLLDDAAEDAKTLIVECGRCEGKKTIQQTDKVPDPADATKTIAVTRDIRCPTCYGYGKQRILGDKERLKMVFDAMGVLGQGRAPLINIDLRKEIGDESIEDLADSVGKIIQGEVVAPKES